MSERAAFLSRIIAEPDEDTHRLVFADWLEEQGEGERAEFIRVQVGLARTPEKIQVLVDWADGGTSNALAPNPCLGELRTREQELWEIGHEDWCGPVLAAAGVELDAYADTRPPRCYRWRNTATLAVTAYGRAHPPGEPDGPETTIKFTRGFVESITLSAIDFLAHADALLWHPGQTMECPKCLGCGRNGIFACGTCLAERHVPRPCPETAQPIRKVVLTSASATIDTRGGFWHSDLGFGNYRVEGNRMTSSRFPGVEFELPTPATGNINWLTMQVNTGTAENPNWQPIAGHRMSHDGHQEVTIDGVNWFRPEFLSVG